MDFDIIVSFSVLAAVFLILMTDRVRPFLVAIGGAGVLMILGVLPTSKMLDVFSSSAPIMIACMMVIATALSEAGVLDKFADYIEDIAKDNPVKALVLLFAIVLVISAFINNTPTVIILAPVLIDLGRKLNKRPYRYLIPLSFFAIMGGMTTLIGTSTNILVDSIAQDNGLEPFYIFEITAPALVMACAGIAFMAFMGRYMLPEGRERLTRLKVSRMFRFKKPERREFDPLKAVLSIGTLCTVVLLAAVNIMPIAGLALIGAIFLIVTGTIKPYQAYENMDWSILLLIFGMLGIGAALEESGAANVLVKSLVEYTAGLGPVVILAGLYLLTSILTETVTNNAVAVILTPIVITMTQNLGLEPRPYLIAVMLAASASFATPIGYQTNTYVYVKGGYKFTDFLRIGVPMNLLMWALAVILIPLFWDLKA